jgi:transcription antitermination factor NusG
MSISETEPRWFAVKTRSKSEKSVQKALTKKQIHSWVPTQRLFRRWGRATRWVELPLINCYVFVQIVKAQYVPVLETENVTGFIRFNQQVAAIPDHEIETLRLITEEEGLELTAVPGYFDEGDPVEIIRGNLAGLKGKVIKSEGKQKLLVEFEHIGYSLHITLDAGLLHKRRG